jgi:MoxR-like ATPase
MSYEYKRLFDPSPPDGDSAGIHLGDRRDGVVYVYDERIILAVNVALATGRPLLVRGPSGCGKSSMARHIARVRGWRYYEKVISSRTQAHDLLWEVDHLHRLQDAQAKDLQPDIRSYIRPGVLWWAFNRESAARQAERVRVRRGQGPGRLDPNLEGEHDRAVVLLDEIDKADPDVPNNLLVPLGSLEFQVEETGEVVTATEKRAPLVILTTNDERDLPAAFLRRCIELELKAPEWDRLQDIVRRHFPDLAEDDLHGIRERIERAAGEKGAGPPSPAELLDVVRAWSDLGPDLCESAWEGVLEVALWKRGRFEANAG